MGRDRGTLLGIRRRYQFQSTRPVWGATKVRKRICIHARVSIHAPRVGRDSSPRSENTGISCFNPRAPCGARHRIRSRHSPACCFNPRAPCGARLQEILDAHHVEWVSIHAPRVGRDARLNISPVSTFVFQSTRPVWGATWCGCSFLLGRHNFNPRAPCGARRMAMIAPWRQSNFNPRAPCGARQRARRHNMFEYVFQSTRPVWGAT